MQTCLVEVPSKDEKKEHDIVNPALGCIMMLQENSNIQISANWWKNTASSQNLKLLGDFLLGLSHSRDFLKTWPLTLRSASLRVFVDAPVVSTWKSIIALTKLGHPAPSLSGRGVKMTSVPTWQANLRHFIWKLLARPKDPVFIASKDPPEKLMWWRELIGLLEGKSCRSAAPQNINILLELTTLQHQRDRTSMPPAK